MMSTIQYTSDVGVVTDQEFFSVVIPPVSSKRELLEGYNLMLKFPYFGFNWDALWDLLCDFHWITQRHIHIYHESVASIPVEDLKVFLEIIVRVCEDWKIPRPALPLWRMKTHHFYFNSNEEEHIKSIIQSLSI